MISGADILWSEEKNRQLRAERGLAFEDVIAAIEDGLVLDDLKHPDPVRRHQRILVVEIDGYVCAVPYVQDGQAIFLKTIYRGRELHQKYPRVP